MKFIKKIFYIKFIDLKFLKTFFFENNQIQKFWKKVLFIPVLYSKIQVNIL